MLNMNKLWSGGRVLSFQLNPLRGLHAWLLITVRWALSMLCCDALDIARSMSDAIGLGLKRFIF